MPESHWVALTIERLNKCQMDSVVRKYISKELDNLMESERNRLIALHKELTAMGK